MAEQIAIYTPLSGTSATQSLRRKMAATVREVFATSAQKEAEAEAKHAAEVERVHASMSGKAPTFHDPLKGKRSDEEQARHDAAVDHALKVMTNAPRDMAGNWIE